MHPHRTAVGAEVAVWAAEVEGFAFRRWRGSFKFEELPHPPQPFLIFGLTLSLLFDPGFVVAFAAHYATL